MKKQDAFGNLHERARRLIDQELVEGLESREQRWLEDHLAGCEACAAWAASADAVLQTIKSVSVAPPPGLAASTSLRVREEAAQLKRRRARNLALIVGCTVSWAAGVVSAPFVWSLCEWFGTKLDLPRIVWQLGFLSWWLVPAAAASLVILCVQSRTESEEIDGRLKARPGSNKL